MSHWKIVKLYDSKLSISSWRWWPTHGNCDCYGKWVIIRSEHIFIGASHTFLFCWTFGFNSNVTGIELSFRTLKKKAKDINISIFHGIFLSCSIYQLCSRKRTKNARKTEVTNYRFRQSLPKLQVKTKYAVKKLCKSNR